MLSSKEFWSVVLAFFPAFFVYQFGRRSKGSDSFLEGLVKSYENAYFPMYTCLRRIKEQPLQEKGELLAEFFNIFDSPDSNVKLVASSFLLEQYFKLHSNYLGMVNSENKNREQFWNSFEELYKMVEREFWETHDIIYRDYLISKALITKNPFIRVVMELIVLLYNVTTFLLYVSLIVLYFSVWHYLNPISVLPNWWTLYYALLFVVIALMAQGFMLLLSGWCIPTKNRRKIAFSQRVYLAIEQRLFKIAKYVKEIILKRAA